MNFTMNDTLMVKFSMNQYVYSPRCKKTIMADIILFLRPPHKFLSMLMAPQVIFSQLNHKSTTSKMIIIDTIGKVVEQPL